MDVQARKYTAYLAHTLQTERSLLGYGKRKLTRNSIARESESVNTKDLSNEQPLTDKSDKNERKGLTIGDIVNIIELSANTISEKHDD